MADKITFNYIAFAKELCIIHIHGFYMCHHILLLILCIENISFIIVSKSNNSKKECLTQYYINAIKCICFLKGRNFEIIFYLKRSNCEIIALLFTRNKYFINFPKHHLSIAKNFVSLWSIMNFNVRKSQVYRKNAFYIIKSLIQGNIYDKILL